MHIWRHIGFVLLLAALSSGVACQPHEASSPTPPNTAIDAREEPVDGIADYGETRLSQIISGLHPKSSPYLVMTQLGDSHTAGDFFTGRLRELFAEDYGTANPGWLPPMTIPGQRTANVTISSQGWELSSSRRDEDSNFPVGGFIASPTRVGAAITVDLRTPANSLWQLKLWLRGYEGSSALRLGDARGFEQQLQLSAEQQDGSWQLVQTYVQLPFSVSANDTQGYQLGGYVIEQQYADAELPRGVSVDAIGVNGARLLIWSLWGHDWAKQLKERGSQIVVLAYGTNEAFSEKQDLYEIEQTLRQSVALIRENLPDAAILIVGAPDSAFSKQRGSGMCQFARPPLLDEIKRIQQRVAIDEHTLFWDSQQAMGGACNISNWHYDGLAQPDMVHLTRDGYYRLAESFYRDFKVLLDQQSQDN